MGAPCECKTIQEFTIVKKSVNTASTESLRVNNTPFNGKKPSGSKANHDVQQSAFNKMRIIQNPTDSPIPSRRVSEKILEMLPTRETWYKKIMVRKNFILNPSIYT